ncbi:MAG: flagellar motor switch protein FliG [Gammaproteobacteria bacterium]|jgi:flagellar motor switch protein FliG|nr:flagellar motor switch protein FliG [Gammaproteobacteria bacterium]
MKKGPEAEALERAAIFMMSLNSDDAAKLLKYLGPKEVQKLGMAMVNVDKVDNKTVHQIYNDFILETESQTSIGLNKDEQIRKVMIGALGEDRANSIIDKILVGNNSGIDALKWMDSKSIADIIHLEHPQIQAIILSYLEPEQAAEVVMCLDEKVRLDLIMRISMQESIQPAALDELNRIMDKQMSASKVTHPKLVGGLKCAANILNYIEPAIETDLMEALREKDEQLATQIQDLMFVFNNLLNIDDRGIQTLLREIKTDTLVVALKGAEPDVKAKIFKNMSKRASALLQDDLEAKGPVRISEVEKAQKEILTIAKGLADAGKITLGVRSEEMI